MTTVQNYETVETEEEMTERQRMIENIRHYADLLQTHPNLPIPWSMHESAYLTEEDARIARRGIYGWTKHNTRESSYITYSKVIGGDGERWGQGTFTLEITVNKEDSQCQRVQTGTRHVEGYSVEAHDEPVYTWRCDSDEPASDPTVFGPED